MAYRADIEIAVRGAQQLRQLKDELNATAKAVESVEEVVESVEKKPTKRKKSTKTSTED